MWDLRGRGAAAFAAWALFVSGCGSPPPTESDGSGTDGGPTRCASNAACDDGVFCNGAELCRPADPSADPLGCVAGARACTAPAVCNEMTDACITGCADADGDGHGPVSCGGDDCDDADAHAYPGNTEVCDPANRDEDCDPTTFGDRDLDGDGETSSICCNGTHCGLDCNDAQRGTHSTIPEICDGIDNDCDSAIDEGLSVRLYLDADHDGIGDESRMVIGCPGAPGVSDVVGDCDDTRASVRPSAPEICDSLDNDCDSHVDEATLSVPWYVDADGDGWGRVDAMHPSIDSCVPPAGRAIRVGDCDDGDAMISPTSAERCNGRDDDCNGRADYVISGRDTEDDDGDGVADAACMVTPADCDDRDQLATQAGAPEVCDLFDNDCDGTVDEDTSATTWYVDADGDGFGDAAAATASSCTPVAGHVTVAGDCDDTDRGTHPGAADSCEGRLRADDDCDGMIDEGGVGVYVFLDADDDGYGTGTSYRTCLAEVHTATRGGDCDDARAAVNPGALDDCASLAGVDDDCDMMVDETTAPRTFYADGDGDGYGNGAPMSGCIQPVGTALTNDDCDDADRFRNPGVPDDCATRVGLDDDCDGSVDEGRALMPFYVDADHDGYGTGAAMMACTAPAGTVALGGDCDDASALRNPGAPDDCTRTAGVDDDCDGRIDEAAMLSTVYRDVDGDGYGAGTATSTCGVPLGYVTMGGDCDESSVAVHPGVADDCTTRIGVDDNCNGTTDENVVLRAWYADADRDGYGTGASMMACAAPTGFPASASGDCDDANANRNPGRADDCTGVAGVDDNCNGAIDEGVASSTYYRDADGDGFGDPATFVRGCATMAGYVANNTDCNDASAAAHPGGSETIAASTCANGVDDDCDGTSDCADSGCAAATSCGSTLSATAGDMQTGAIHAPLASPLTVRLVDGGGSPLAGRTLSLVTTSFTAVGYSGITDASGQYTFTGLHAPFPLGTETFRVQALGVPDLVLHATATAPAAGTIFTIFNGLRRTVTPTAGRPTLDSSVFNGNSGGWLSGASDGTIYAPIDDTLWRIRADGSMEQIGGATCCGVVLPTGTPMAASATRVGGTSSMPTALDETRNRLYFAVSCGIYYYDIATSTIVNYMGRHDRCGTSGDGGAALDAGSGVIGSLAVTDSGVLWFQTGGGLADRNIRVIDTGGRVTRVIDGNLYSNNGIQMDFFPGTVSAIPGSDDALLSTQCTVMGNPQHQCILRVDAAGRLTHIAGGPGTNLAEGIDAHLATIDSNGAWPRAFPDGSIIIAEQNVGIIRRISPAGIINTIAGTRGMLSDTGDNGPASAALLSHASLPTVWRSTHLAFYTYYPLTIRAIW